MISPKQKELRRKKELIKQRIRYLRKRDPNNYNKYQTLDMFLNMVEQQIVPKWKMYY